ncbi:putative transcriptional regulatory protein pdtaR [Clostridium sp. C105KSO15]|nr:putative transcriptional regulatory protein pdtaR [Clostridium sp. C105KSO15]
MKILLADDERLIRLGLKSMIEELCPNMHQFIEVENGEKLLKQLEKEIPDLIFLDIHMPMLTGLQAFSQFHMQKIPVVMLTGYAEFSYAQEALKLGALDYLLKPASLEEVKATMEKAASLFRERELLLKKDYELEFEKILDLHTSIRFLQSPKYVLPPYTAVLFYVDHYHKETFKNDLDVLNAMLSSISSRYGARYTFTFLPTGEICYLTSTVIPSGEFQGVLVQFHQTSGCMATGFHVSAGNLSELFTQFESVQREESLRLCVHLGSVISEKERLTFSRLLPFSDLLEKLLMANQADDVMGFQNLLHAISQFPHEKEIFELCDDSLNRILSMESGTTANILSIRQLVDFLKQMTTQNQSIDLIDKINAYIEEHYMDQIGINTIADMIDISPNYLSKIYKMKTGEKFVDHLTGVRMKKAMELMSGGHTITVRDTAERVGYFSTRYFTKVFLKSTGISPSEYMKGHLLNEGKPASF